jgi:hypothetical protein
MAAQSLTDNPFKEQRFKGEYLLLGVLKHENRYSFIMGDRLEERLQLSKLFNKCYLTNVLRLLPNS